MVPESFSQLKQFFSELTDEERKRLLAGEGIFEKKKIKKDIYVFEEGDQDDELYLILEGRVEISKKVGQEGKRRKILAILNQGTIFGEGALLTGHSRSASAKALSELEVLVLSRSNFNAFVKENPEDAVYLLMGLLRVVNQRLIWTNHELVTLYDISEMVGDYHDDMQTFFDRITDHLSGLTKAADGFIVYRNISTHANEVIGRWGTLELSDSDLKGIEKSVGDQRFLLEDNRFVAPIRDLSGTYLGFIVMEKTEDWTIEQQKLSLAIADELAIAIADYHTAEHEKGRSKLAQKNIQF